MAEEREGRADARGRNEARDEGQAQRGGRRGRSGPFRGGGGRRGAGRRGCSFCQRKVTEIGYKDVEGLRYYLTERGKIKARRKSATCAKHQRRLAIAIKRARHLALLPFTVESMRG